MQPQVQFTWLCAATIMACQASLALSGTVICQQTAKALSATLVKAGSVFRALARPVLQLQENQVRLLGQRDLAKFNIDVEHRSTSADVEPDVQPEPCSTSLS
jgi:hypothetical protein